MTNPKPIAYGNGTSGGVYHVDCWYAHADEHYGQTRARAFLGTVYHPGAERKELKNERCKRCGQPFPAPRLGEHVHNLGESGNPHVTDVHPDSVTVTIASSGEYNTKVARDDRGQLWSL